MTDPTRVMLDIETLGLEPGAAILSVGACEFDTDGVGETFYREVDIESCQTHGLDIDAGTLAWWLSQDDAARAVLDGGDDLIMVLKALSMWWPDADTETWANSPAFDCAHLEAAYAALGLTEPWAYYETRDVRTLRSLPVAVDVAMEGIEHNALDDAIHQAREVAATLAVIDQ